MEKQLILFMACMSLLPTVSQSYDNNVLVRFGFTASTLPKEKPKAEEKPQGKIVRAYNATTNTAQRFFSGTYYTASNVADVALLGGAICLGAYGLRILDRLSYI